MLTLGLTTTVGLTMKNIKQILQDPASPTYPTPHCVDVKCTS